ncbi:cell division control protein 2 homolog 2 [Citrus clementina]|uniref:cell division control protein 2 homolog 2 n=1 Tax=Citrus clementina TaxID=85681 RepID=UPI000CED3ACC|nr:cell division control protein 2 homolog 2 [Citrus x clementina]
MKKVKDCCYKVVKKTNGSVSCLNILGSEQMEKVKDWNYKVVEKIGQGVFGEVYKCLNLETGKKVAIKMINIQNEPEGVPSYLIAGVSLLKELEHDNIVRLLDVLTSGRYVYLVFEYLDLDLGSFIRKHTATSIRPHIKTILSQILVGLAYYHSHNILHGDLQPSNVLIDLKSKKVKLADFGLTTSFGVPHIEYSYNEVGSPYKAPESRIRSSVYSTPHDVWAVGCIFAEMVSGNPLFPCGKKDHLSLIVSLFGKPTKETWPGANYISELLHSHPQCMPADLAEQLLGLGLEPPGVELLSQMLYLDPDLRVTANGALLHRYLRHAEDIRIAETVPLKLPSSNKPSFSQKVSEGRF